MRRVSRARVDGVSHSEKGEKLVKHIWRRSNWVNGSENQSNKVEISGFDRNPVDIVNFFF